MCARCYGRNGRPCSHTGVKCISAISSGGLYDSRGPGCTSTNRFAASIACCPSKGQNQMSLPGFEHAAISFDQTAIVNLGSARIELGFELKPPEHEIHQVR